MKSKEPSGWKEFLVLRAKTVHERAKLMAASGERSRLDLSPAHVLELLERYPVLYREAWVTPSNTASRFACDGFDVGGGWFRIVDALSAKLARDKALHVVQLKEKYGRLTVYFERDEGVPVDRRLDAMLDVALDKAGDRSTRTCEVCGGRGTREKRGHTVCVRCVSCLQIEEMVDACRRIAECTKGLDSAAFSANENSQDAVRLAMLHIGHASFERSPKSRARLPGIDWASLDRLQDTAGIMRISAKEIWKFVREDAPELERKLR